MKQVLCCLLVIVASSFIVFKKSDITPADRKFAVEYYTKTKDRLLNDVSKLNEAQLNFKPDTSRWSIAQCIEHIALAENGLWQWCMQTLKNDTSTVKKPENVMANEQLIAMVTDRSHKAQAPEMLQPKNAFSNEQGSLKAYISKRDSTINYLKTTNDNLRDRYMQTALGTIDVYQGLLLLASHSERHTLQIEEIIKSPGFPKSK